MTEGPPRDLLFLFKKIRSIRRIRGSLLCNVETEFPGQEKI